MKIFTKGTIISLVIIVVTFIVSAYFFPILPERIASHWNEMGEVNGYMSKFWGTFLIPILMIVFLFIFLVVPRMDPKQKNIEEVRGAYDAFLVSLFIFFGVIQGFILAANLGSGISANRVFPVAIGFLLIVLGFIFEKLKQNWTIGIRTPWTLSSEVVWNKTHALGGKVFKIIGIIACLGAAFSQYAVWFFLSPIILGIIIIFVYSYRIYKKEQAAVK